MYPRQHVVIIAFQPLGQKSDSEEGGFWTLICINIYAPLICTAHCKMFWMHAYPLRGEVGGGWALEFESFLGPVKFGAQPQPFPLPQDWICTHPETLCTGLYKS
jgi:hypothetical protein